MRLTALLLCLAAATSGCRQSKDSNAYVVHNFTGQDVIAPVLLNQAHIDSEFAPGIVEGHAWSVGALGSLREVRSVRLDWIAGAGRARWFSVTVPVQAEQASGTVIELIMRPDHVVCASLVDSAHAADRPRVLARTRQDVRTHACAQPVELPRLAPGMAAGLVQEARARTFGPPRQGLTHTSGPVALRFGIYKHQAFFAGDFGAVLPIGQGAAWLVHADKGPAVPGWFIVTANDKQWQARYVGPAEGPARRLDGNLILLGANIVVDTVTADVFTLPGVFGIAYGVLGAGPDGRHVAGYLRQPGPGPAVYQLQLLDLETGQAVPQALPPVPGVLPGSTAAHFYGAWYRQHCTWQPLLACA